MSHATDSALVVEHEIRIEAPRDRVFRLLSDQAEMARWMPVSLFEPHVGGRFEMVAGEWVAFGEVTQLDPPRRLAYTWDWQNQPLGTRTEVTFDLEADGQATILRLRHAGFTSPEQAASHTTGWTHYEERLSAVAEGRDPGPDAMAGEGEAGEDRG